MTSARRILTFLLLAALFGLAMGATKGDHSGWRGAVGNLSAPWLLVAVLPSLRCRTPWRGALMGLGSTLVALGGFYAAVTLALAGHLGGGGYVDEFLVETLANHIYFFAGAVTGPLMGAFGAWLGRRYPGATWLVIGGLVAGEIVGVALLQGHQLAPPPLYFEWTVADWRPYVAESILGLGILAVAVWRCSRAPI